MVTVACPWCEEDVAVTIADLARKATFHCPCCATSVSLVDDVTEGLELAA
jgi:endogenous inhibitor of DNA gyrase (YacG/DUF329 family)